MSRCGQCGRELGDGRFCPGCGAPADGDGVTDWRTDTAERARVLPPVAEPRFPLFADEADPHVTEPPPDATAPLPTVAPERHRAGGGGRRRSPVLPWVLGFAGLVLVAGLGAWMLFAGGEDPSDTTEEAAAGTADSAVQPSPTGSPQSPSADGTGTTGPASPRAKPTDLSGSAAVDAPAPAPPSRDTKGRVVRYQASNMLDGDPMTAWRMRGDGTGETIRFTFDEPVSLRRVGLINGYAKTGASRRGAVDWYAGNRRIRAVEWTFDDGTAITQRLRHTRLMQSKRLGPVESATVTLRLVEVSPPGPGRASRDYTAISGVQLLGTR